MNYNYILNTFAIFIFPQVSNLYISLFILHVYLFISFLNVFYLLHFAAVSCCKFQISSHPILSYLILESSYLNFYEQVTIAILNLIFLNVRINKHLVCDEGSYHVYITFF